MEILRPGFRLETLAKTTFPLKSFFNDSRIDFRFFSEAVRAVLLIFAALETGLKIECFFIFQGHPGARQPAAIKLSNEGDPQ